MKKIYNILYVLVSGLLLCLVPACSHDIATDNPNDSYVRLGRASVESESDSKLLTPPEGTYYLYYKANNSEKEKECQLQEGGIFENFGKTDIEWNDLTAGDKTAGFILTNSKTITPATSDTTDILWGKIAPATSNELKFVLKHRMARVSVKLTIPTGWTVTKILLKNLRNEYTYSKDNGEVAVNTGQSLTELTVPTTYNSLLLPPQERQSTSELYVTVNDGTADKAYHHVLPYSMRKEVSPGQWIDVPLVFTAGHLLELGGRIEDNPSYTIYFTYATLTDWNQVWNGTISARPEGLYSVNDITGWIKAWNEKDEIRLKKYGTKEADKWTFTLRREVTITKADLSSATFINLDFTLKVEDGKSYQIVGIQPSDIGLDDTIYKGIIVKTKTPQP